MVSLNRCVSTLDWCCKVSCRYIKTWFIWIVLNTLLWCFYSQDRDSDNALCLKNKSCFENQHHHLLHCLEKTTVSTAQSVTGHKLWHISCSKYPKWSISSCISNRTMSSQTSWRSVRCVWLSRWAIAPAAALLSPVSRGCRRPVAPAGLREEPSASPTPPYPSAEAAYRSWTLCKCTIALLDPRGTTSHRPWWFIHIKKRKSIIWANRNFGIITIWKKVCITAIEHRI